MRAVDTWEDAGSSSRSGGFFRGRVGAFWKRLISTALASFRMTRANAIVGQRPVVVLFERGARRGIVCLWIDDFANLIEET